MLATRPANRDKVKFFSREMLFDIYDGDELVGSLGYDPRKFRGTFSCNGKDYVVERAIQRGDELLYEAAIRAVLGRKKPANPYLLKDSGSRVLAEAESVRSRFDLIRGGESFTFRKASLFSRPYHLYRANGDQSVGSVGQKKLLARGLYMDLPAEFDAPFQIFLLVLLLDASMKALESASPTLS